MFDRPRSGERALLVHVGFDPWSDQEEQVEFEELARSAGAHCVASLTVHPRRPSPRYLIGSGKVEEIKQEIVRSRAELLLIDHALTPSQERNLERALECRVLDRTGLILDIFAQRARSFEGKLQVELAQLRHLSTRLVRGWTHLERQKGGIGLRGPGETQLETDRRLLSGRIRALRARLEKVRRQREQGRSTRRKASVSTVSLVGYTNAGKSTLFNALTGADVYSADKLFATLDPTLRRLDLGDGGEAVLADTVGFIRDLPHELVAAFHSTLQEIRDAHLVLHVVDAAEEIRTERIDQVGEVLREIEADDVPQLEVFNKIDRTDESPRIERDADGLPVRVWLSAQTGAGLDLLRGAISERIGAQRFRGRLHLLAGEGRLRAQLFQIGAVRAEKGREDGGWDLDVEIPDDRLRSLCAREGHELPGPCSAAPSFLQIARWGWRSLTAATQMAEVAAKREY